VTKAFVFPGQGSQSVGMGRDLAEAFPVAREVFQEVDEALGQHLARLMFEGPERELTLTENAQPAIMAASLAVVRVLQQEAGILVEQKAAFVAGHSLGEYSALAAAGSLELADAARLLKKRGQAMQEAVPEGEGAMAALLGMELDAVKALAAEAAEGEVCDAANDNAPGQIVISGHAGAVARAVKLAEAQGKKAIMLQVSAPFHSSLMAPAADVMGEALADTVLQPLRVPLIANVTAAPVREPEVVRRLLVEQITAPVRWRESVLTMRDNEVDTLIEIGASKVLCGMARRIDRALTALPVGTPGEIEAALKIL